jgi:XisH protein
MPARNIYHAAVVRALTAEGWTITHDPYPLSFGGKDLFVDLGAEETTLAAEKEGRRIAVEIQSFLGHSPVRSLEEAVGQYAIYRLLLARIDPDRVLYMAVSVGTYRGVLADQFGQLVVSGLNLRLVVFDDQQERIVQWIG